MTSYSYGKALLDTALLLASIDEYKDGKGGV
jgi:hypothetical protein